MTLVICAWCRNAGQPSFLREKEPYIDDSISHGMCESHEAEWRAQADELHASRAGAGREGGRVMLRWLWRIIMGGRYSKRNIILWSWLRRWASAPILAANYPDMPTARPEGEWLILDHGHWGTLAATHVGDNSVILSVWKGYEQTHGGILLRRADIGRMLEYLDQGLRGPIRPVV